MQITFLSRRGRLNIRTGCISDVRTDG